jgi:membrane associated rhomboid family serine protease
MSRCPECRQKLKKQKFPRGVVYVCAQCGGRAAGIGLLRSAGAPAPLMRDIWRQAATANVPHERPCPHCARPMAQVHTTVLDQPLKLDVCKPCAAIWFDPNELEVVPIPTPDGAELSEKARELLALMKLKSLDEHAATADATPDEAWQWLPFLLGLPVERNAPMLSCRPWLTWLVTAACIVATWPILMAGEGAFRPGGYGFQWGFIPAQWLRHGGLTMATSFFLHGGVWHLVGNLYFLLVFGDNVEDNLGRLRFLLLIAGAHVAGVILHSAFGPHANMPCVGASAGISGVIAYYAITFPRVRLTLLFRIHVFFYPLSMSAATAFVLYLLLQLLGVWLQVAGMAHVSYLGHLGGLIVGIAAAVYVRTNRRHTAKADMLDAPD